MSDRIFRIKNIRKLYFGIFFVLVFSTSLLPEVLAQFERDVSLYYISEEDEKSWDKVHKNYFQINKAIYTDSTICYIIDKSMEKATFTKYYHGGILHIKGEDLEIDKNGIVLGRSGQWKFYTKEGRLKKEIYYGDAGGIQYWKKYDEHGNIIKNYDDLRYSYGFIVGTGAYRVSMTEKPEGFDLEPHSGTIDLGFYFGYKLTKKNIFSVMPTIIMSIDSYRSKFELNEEIKEENFFRSVIKLPVAIRYYLTRNVILTSGIYGGFDISAGDEEKLDIINSLSWINYGLDMGIGYEIKIGNIFKLIPEITYSHQLNNWIKDGQDLHLPFSIRENCLQFKLIIKDLK